MRTKNLINQIEKSVKKSLTSYLFSPLTEDEVDRMKKAVKEAIFQYADKLFDEMNVKEGGGYIPIIYFEPMKKKQMKNRELNMQVILVKQRPWKD
jgi:hypothetical protein